MNVSAFAFKFEKEAGLLRELNYGNCRYAA